MAALVDAARNSTARLEDALEDLLAVLPFRLPSEAEWEYAARAGTTLTFRGDHKPGEEQILDHWIHARGRTGADLEVVREELPGPWVR